MHTTFWGPHAWIFLHAICFNYPFKPDTEDKKNIKDYVLAFIKNIPCTGCKFSFADIYDSLKIDEFLGDKYGVFLWSYLIHDIVNQKLHKVSIHFEDAVELYISKSGLEIDRAKYIEKTFDLYPKYAQGISYNAIKNKKTGCDLKSNLTNIFRGVLVFSVLLNLFLLFKKFNINIKVKKNNSKLLFN